MTGRVPLPRNVVTHDVAQRRVRAYRVEVGRLEACTLCGGTVEDVEDVSLRCDCAERRHEIEQRAQGILSRHRVDHRGLADVLAP